MFQGWRQRLQISVWWIRFLPCVHHVPLAEWLCRWLQPIVYSFDSGKELQILNTNMQAKRLGDIQDVINSNPHHKAAAKYNHIRIQFPNGDEKSLLFTDKEIENALHRASKNPEDLPKVSWLRDLID